MSVREKTRHLSLCVSICPSSIHFISTLLKCGLNKMSVVTAGCCPDLVFLRDQSWISCYFSFKLPRFLWVTSFIDTLFILFCRLGVWGSRFHYFCYLWHNLQKRILKMMMIVIDAVTWSPSRHPASWIGPRRSVELNSRCPSSSSTLE